MLFLRFIETDADSPAAILVIVLAQYIHTSIRILFPNIYVSTFIYELLMDDVCVSVIPCVSRIAAVLQTAFPFPSKYMEYLIAKRTSCNVSRIISIVLYIVKRETNENMYVLYVYTIDYLLLKSVTRNQAI